MADCCSVCGENSVRDDFENGRKIRVCIECGSLENDSDELTSEAQFEGTTVTKGQSYGPKGGKAWMNLKSQTNKAKETGKKLMKHVGLQLNLSEDMNVEAFELYERVYDEELVGVSDDVKKAWSLACFYVSGRNHGYALNIRDLVSFLNIDNGTVKCTAALKLLKVKYNVHLVPVDVSSETHSIFTNSELPNEVIRMAQQLMMLLQRMLVTQGRSITTCAVPCVYHAWKAWDFINNRKVTLNAFCKKFKLPRRQCYRKDEIENAFKKMAMEIPWIKASGQDVKYVEPHLKDVIKYQSLLISEAVQSALSNIEEQSLESEPACGTDDIDVAKIFRVPPRKRIKLSDKENDREKRQITKMRRKQRDNTPDDGIDSTEDNSDIESFDLGSDDDTDAYILSEKEVELKQEFEKCLDAGV